MTPKKALNTTRIEMQVIDSHTEGEPTRLVVAGGPPLGNGSLSERKALFARDFDHYRVLAANEPRGYDAVVGALLCEPVDRSCAAGLIFFNNTGYLGMCGHGTIGLIASLAYLGRITPGEHRIETPVGTVTTTLHTDGSVSVRNVPAYRLHHALVVEVPGYGQVVGDVAWGGNWFFLISDHGQRVASDNLEALMAYSCAVQQALKDQGIRGDNGGEIDHIELFADDDQADSRNYVLCPGKAYDRSPCGTGTSAKVACLAADGKLAPGALWRQASIIGSQFEASYTLQDDGKLIPTLRGRAHMSAEATLLIEDSDPFGWGIRL